MSAMCPGSKSRPATFDSFVAATLVRWAAETNIPLIPRGSGSSMAGGAIGDGVIVDLSRLDAAFFCRTSELILKKLIHGS